MGGSEPLLESNTSVYYKRGYKVDTTPPVVGKTVAYGGEEVNYHTDDKEEATPVQVVFLKRGVVNVFSIDHPRSFIWVESSSFVTYRLLNIVHRLTYRP